MEFLYQNGAKLTVSDEKGRGCLHYAALSDDARYAVFTVMHACRNFSGKHVFSASAFFLFFMPLLLFATLVLLVPYHMTDGGL